MMKSLTNMISHNVLPASFREILPDKNDIFVCIQAPFSYRYRTLITRDWMNKFSFYTNIGKASKCFPLKA